MKPQEIMDLLDRLYAKVLEGAPPTNQGVVAFSEAYLRKSDNVDDAAMKLIRSQIHKCTASGFLTGLGGILTLPIALSANVASVLYFQLRLIAGLAYLGGYDVYSPQVRTMSYVCLAGLSVEQMLKNTGIKVGTRLTKSLVAKLPGKLTASINQKVGYRLFTKFGNRSLASLGKAVPLVGGVVSGSLDFVETRMIAQRAYEMFIEGQADHTADFAEFQVVEEETLWDTQSK